MLERDDSVCFSPVSLPLALARPAALRSINPLRARSILSLVIWTLLASIGMLTVAPNGSD